MGGFAAAFTAFLTAAVVLVGLLFTAALTVGRAERHTIDRISAHAPAIKRWGGWILTAVGAWLLALAAFADFFAALFPV